MAFRTIRISAKTAAVAMTLAASALLPTARAADHATLQVSLTVVSVCTVGSQQALAGQVGSNVNVSCSARTPYLVDVSNTNLHQTRSALSRAEEQAVSNNPAAQTQNQHASANSSATQSAVATITF
ncbi:hypothetical protein JCM19000A_29400 [Silvimonas sp. JCM 19000]